jgi:HPt (histidine-containing phosphotransfer) domain-containing protein
MDNVDFEIDKEFLNSYYKELVNEVGEIFQLFLEETPSDIQQINENFSTGKYKEVAQVLHKIAPCFYNVGLPTLTPKVKAIEVCIHAGDIDNAKSQMKRFEAELNEFLPAVIKEHQRLIAYDKVA